MPVTFHLLTAALCCFAVYLKERYRVCLGSYNRNKTDSWSDYCCSKEWFVMLAQLFGLLTESVVERSHSTITLSMVLRAAESAVWSPHFLCSHSFSIAALLFHNASLPRRTAGVSLMFVHLTIWSVTLHIKSGAFLPQSTGQYLLHAAFSTIQ